MKAVVVKNQGFEIGEKEKPELKGKGAIVKINGCGLCGSDLVKLKHGTFKDGDVPGHEIVGTIVSVNTDADFMPGDRIVAGHHVPCYECVFCYGQNHSMCRKFKNTNIVPGGFAEYVYLSEDHLLNTTFKVPGGVSDEHISFTEPFACCLRAVKRMKINYGSNVLIIGLGSIGILMGQAAKTAGYRVFGIDLISDRVLNAKKYGFDDTYLLQNTDETVTDMKLENCPNGFDAIIMTSGADAALELALKAVRDGGLINVFSSVKLDETSYSNNEIYYRELSVIGSYSSSPAELEESFDLLVRGAVKTEGLYSVYKFDEINSAISDEKDKKIYKAYLKP